MSNSKQRRAERRSRTADAHSTRDGLANMVAGLGTPRDKAAYTEWTTPLILAQKTLENMYRSSWLAKKIVNLPAEDMTRAWREFSFDDDPSTSDDERKDGQAKIKKAEQKFQLKAKITAALKWSRLYGGASILMGVGNPLDYDKPLDPARVKKGELKFLLVLDRWMLVPTGQRIWDIADPAFGQPEFYTIANTAGRTVTAPRIHHSRVVRFMGQELPYYPTQEQAGWGDSELQHVYDTLTGRDTITAAIATMMFEANVDVLKSPELNQMLSTDDGEKLLTKRFQLAAMMKSFNRMLLLDGAEEYDKKQNSFSNLDAIMREFRAEVSGAADIPVTRLFGTSVGGLNATGDNEVRNYYDGINAKQEADLRPALDKIDAVLFRSELGMNPEDACWNFCELWQQSDTEKADNEKKRAERDQIYFDMGVVTEGTIARQLKQDGTYSAMTDEDVQLAEELAAALEESRLNPPAPVAPGEEGNNEDPAATAAPGEKANEAPAEPEAGKGKS